MGNQNRKFGDRKDAKRINDISGLAQISIDLKPGRCNSDVYINQKMDMTKLVEFVEKRQSEGKEITYFHVFVAGIAKLMYSRPKLNRFVANRHIYEHNDVVISFVAKTSFDDKAEQMMILVKIDPDDDIYTISEKIKNKVNKVRNSNSLNKQGANKAIDVLGKMPNILRVPVIGLFKWCDAKGILPSGFVKDNLYYSSIIVSNLGSIHCGAIYHNINNFGTCSSLLTMGEIKPEEVMNKDGKKEIKNICEFGANMDERIADGYYFAKSLQMLQQIFDNPELLEEKVDVKVKTLEIR